ncbi:uncharacterized protein BXZ73DRAFT_47252, partial [Epithele typhae]|uniref:uncharacterized protein n=1 Tax=Epithele typhae TaxID=378194 RepID=UPI0020073BC1
RNNPEDPRKAAQPLQMRRRPYAVYNYRPASPPPIGIYHRVFSDFRQMMDPNTPAAQPTHDKYDEAHDFCMKALRYYNYPYQREVHGSYQLQRLGLLETQHVEFDGRKMRVDGATLSATIPSGFKSVAAITEINTELDMDGTDPATRAECGYLQIYASDAASPIRAASCCPALLIAHVGPNIQVLGAAFADDVLIEPLTDYISLIPRITAHDDTYDVVVRLFHAIRSALQTLHTHYADIARQLASEGTPSWPLFVEPHFTQFTHPIYGPITLTYTRRLAVDKPSVAVFKAKARFDAGSRDVFVKFTDTYGVEGHKLLEDNQLAPELLYCQTDTSVCATVVVMDFVKGVRVRAPLTDAQEKDLRTAVELLHEQDLVFGDLLPKNVFVLEGSSRIRLVGFDWCGKVGKAQYPCNLKLDRTMEWPAGMDGGELIDKGHDTRFLEQIIAQHV